VSARATMIRHGRFLILNRDRSRLCKGWRVLIALVGPLFLRGAGTIKTVVSVVKKIVTRRNSFADCYTLGP
jgi:hypothetical protein